MSESVLPAKFSIIILYWQNARYLPDCLRACAAQSCQDFEILLLDNGSPSPLDDALLAEFHGLRMQVLHSPVNLGFAGGNNLAARSARGEYLALLNADAFPQPDWLEQIYTAAQSHPNTFFASRLLMADHPELLDGEWNVYHASGLAWRKGHGQPVSQAASTERYVLSACAAAGVYPKSAFDAVGGFDEDFFAYMEDVDLDLRLQLQGCRCLYLPQAQVRHVGSASSAPRSALAVFHGHRNLVWTFIKDMPGWLFWALLPAHILANLAYLLAAPFVPNGREIARGKLAALKALPDACRKRKSVQAARSVSVWQIARLLDWNPFSPLAKLRFK